MNKQNIRIALAQINPIVGDLKANSEKIISWVKKAQGLSADIVSFPELVLTGYPPEDLLFKPKFVHDNLEALKHVAHSVGDIITVVGFADSVRKALYNAAAVVYQGKILDVYHKVFLPNYGVFDEKRYFLPGEKTSVYGIGSTAFGLNICEDIWHKNGPVKHQAAQGAQIIININASPYHIGKGSMRQRILKEQAKKNNVFVSYVNMVGGQDELVFDGQSMVIDPKGKVVARAKAFQEQLLVVDIEIKQTAKKAKKIIKYISDEKQPLPPPVVFPIEEEAEEVYEALVCGLKDYIFKNNFRKVVLGLSGGIDSSLVAAIASDGIGAGNVVGVFMPSVYSSLDSKEDAEKLARNLGIEFFVIPIQEIFEKYLVDLKPAFQGKAPDVTEENLQARIRGNILMALSNKFGYLALNTGNKSEVSCGYCTLYGDMAGGFGVIKDVPKTLVYKLAAIKNKREHKEVIPARVFEKAPTAELRPQQKDSDTLPEYNILDKALKLYVEEDKSISEMVRAGILEEVALRVMRMVDLNEYKRRQAPPGIKITPRAFGRDRRMPITNRYR